MAKEADFFSLNLVYSEPSKTIVVENLVSLSPSHFSPFSPDQPQHLPRRRRRRVHLPRAAILIRERRGEHNSAGRKENKMAF